MIPKLDALDRLIAENITPTKMYLPELQYNQLLWNLTRIQQINITPPDDPKGLEEGRFFYKDIEIIRDDYDKQNNNIS